MLDSEPEHPAVQLANAQLTVWKLSHAFFADPANDRNRFRGDRPWRPEGRFVFVGRSILSTVKCNG
jgi:hypothetical protein